MDTYGTKPKQYAEQINIWYSENTQAWITCAWVGRDLYDGYYGPNKGLVYKKERVAHPDFDAALTFISQNYKERS